MHPKGQYTKGVRKTPGGWYFHPFETVISGTPSREKSAFIRSLVEHLYGEGISCGVLREGSAHDERFVDGGFVGDQDFLRNDLLLIDTNNINDLPTVRFIAPSEKPSDEKRLIGPTSNDNIDSIVQQIRIMATERSAPIATLLLSGGLSSRMGRNKAGIKYRDEPQIVRTAKLLQKVAKGPVTLSIRRGSEQADKILGELPDELQKMAARGEITLLSDRFDGFGPISGILTALYSRPEAAWLVVAVDLPLLEESDLAFLIHNRNPWKFATAFESATEDSQPEPLCTIYEPKSLPRMLSLLGRGVGRPRGFLKESSHQSLSLPRPEALFNANTPEEMLAAQKKLERPEADGSDGRTDKSTDEGIDRVAARRKLPQVQHKKKLTSVNELDRILLQHSRGRLVPSVLVHYHQQLKNPTGFETQLPDFPPPEELPLEQAGGRVLATDIRADRDQPPFNRAAMDGIAVQSAELRDGRSIFSIRGTLPAGSDPCPFDHPASDDAIEIMTGAALPEGYDAVIRYEFLEIVGGEAKVLPSRDSNGNRWANVHRQASDFRQGERVVLSGALINSAVSAILASTGHSKVLVKSSPKITLMSTGTELVPMDSTPLDWQIRQSNISALAAELIGWGLTNVTSEHLRDDRKLTLVRLERAMNEASVLILSGGVSKGKFDYVPKALEELGVRMFTHGVAQKPGKPLLVGILPKKCLVFALPGNPVASITSLRRFVIPFLVGKPALPLPVELNTTIQSDNTLTKFAAVSLERQSDARLLAAGLKGNGSGDFFHLLHSDGFVEIPAGLDSGERIVDFYPWAVRRAGK